MRRSTTLALAALPTVLLAACDPSRPTSVAATTDAAPAHTAARIAALATPTVVAGGLTNPRGLAFGPDGSLYVAEAGTGGLTSTAGHCQQVPGAPGPGPFTGGRTGSITRVDAAGRKTTVVHGLPSSLNALGDVSGVSDVGFVNAHLYALLDAGCGHGVPDVPASLAIVLHDGRWSPVSDLGAFVRRDPVARPEPDDFEPDGDWYSMIADGGKFFAMEANGGQMVRIDPATGGVHRVVDISATEGHIVPTAITADGHGGFFVSNLQELPAVPGGAKIFHISSTGAKRLVTSGFTTVLGLAMAGGDLYVLETLTCPAAPLPCVPAPFAAGTGRVERLDAHGTRTDVATGLTWPTSLRLGPDGALYVSNKGFNTPPGGGEVLRIALAH